MIETTSHNTLCNSCEIHFLRTGHPDKKTEKQLSSIKVPTLLVWGSEDHISPLTNCELLQSAIPGAKKIIIEGAPHPCYLDNPDTWYTELMKFLQPHIN